MPRNPFAKYVAQGYRVQLIHQIGKAAIARVSPKNWVLSADTIKVEIYTIDGVLVDTARQFWAAKHRHHYGEGRTPAAAIQATRKARQDWEANENEALDVTSLALAGFTHGEVIDFVQYNQLDPDFCHSRAELRRVVTMPAKKERNATHYRRHLADLGILLSKPKPAS